MSEKSDTKGICILAGAGPGDPGLTTQRAKSWIERAEVLLYDSLINQEVLRWVPEGTELIYVGKRAGNHAMPQEEINQLLVEKTRAGKVVVRLKGGDPYVFGRGGEEALALVRAGLPFEEIPGVTSALSGPAYAGIPVLAPGRSDSVTILTGHQDPAKLESAIDYAQLARTAGTRVFLMGVTRLPGITEQLIRHGADPATPVAVIRWATTGGQRTVTGTLENIAQRVADAKLTAPALTVVGEVVNFREKLNWFETRPLFGRRIVVTRTRQQAGSLSSNLRNLGADVYELPTIRIAPPEDNETFRRYVQSAHEYDWIVFTSPNGVDAFFEEFFSWTRDVREIGGARIAAVGPATAARIKAQHLKVDVQPEEAVAESLLQALEAQGSVDNLRFLIVRPEVTREILAPSLTRAGALVDEAVAYRTLPETEDIAGGIARFREEGADMITFASSSAVESFLAMKLPMPQGLRIASIGPVTSATIREHGLKPDVEAKPHNIEALSMAIADFYAAGSRS